MKNYGCKARIMEGPNAMDLCGEDCEIVVDKTKESIRHKRKGSEMDIFLYPHTRREYCQYHQRLRDKRFDPFFPDSLKGV